MKNLFRNSLLVSACVLTGVVASTGKAQAQSTDVDFTGTVLATCTINSTTPGTLGIVGPSTLGSWDGGATDGNINVSCNGGTTFTINSITNNGTDPATFSNLNSNASLGSPQIANFLGSGGLTATSALQPGPIVNKDYMVGLTTSTADLSPLAAGNYGLRVNVSLNPQ